MYLTKLVDYLFSRSGHYVMGDLSALGLTLDRFWNTIKHDIKDYERFKPLVKRFNLSSIGQQHYDFTVDRNNTGYILQQLAPEVTVNGSAGVATWSYVVVGLGSDTIPVCVSEIGSVTTGNTTLTSMNNNSLSWTLNTHAVSYQIYRTVAGGTPSTTGLIGTTTGLTFNDTGIAGNGAVPPVASNGVPPIFITKVIPVGTMSVISVMAYGLTPFARNSASPSRLVDPVMFLWDFNNKPSYDDNTNKLYVTGWGSFDVVGNYRYLITETRDANQNLIEVYIQGLEEDYILLNLLYGKFLQQLGHMKRAFKYDDLPITVDGNELIEEGRETYDAARIELYGRHKWWNSVRP